MKNRVIFGIIGTAVGVGSLCIIFVPVYLGFMISLISVAAVYEIMTVSKIENKALLAVTAAVAAFIPSELEYRVLDRLGIPTSLAVTVYVMLLLTIMIACYGSTRFEHIATALVSSIVVPYAFSCYILVRDAYELAPDYFDKKRCFYLLLTGMFCTWITDTFALFTGIKFGKHKLAPKISPKKSVEGAVGGVVGALLSNVVLWFIFDRFVFDERFIPLWAAMLLSVVLSLSSMLGDISASVIKRNNGAKDFSNLIPGHGGIMDRFDSFSFVFPTMYIIIQIYLAIVSV